MSTTVRTVYVVLYDEYSYGDRICYVDKVFATEGAAREYIARDPLSYQIYEEIVGV